ncbi:GNAT family N-acetyltransferase [Streptacidiphilus sp. PB12-B1b]|uniref:GNAT family N-acetyltransferase n=1 Tax=Streptacidiphilus sp. PB12-B1b TaxID=2705012 RepID=UPI0015F883C0|nr:GNAT family N-acetyltransferase [Streptacidiphilus sp. PB12-B1b]QMU75401.1 GNAT family N-acetyltransferase [Streptacidiphilus sp. PB12-B1b]
MTRKRIQDEGITVVRLGEGPGLREDEIDGWFRIEAACAVADDPGDPDAPARPEPGGGRNRVAAVLRAVTGGEQLLRWLARDAEGEPVGTAVLRLVDAEGLRDSARFQLSVHPDRRREGVGGLLLEAVREQARASGRSSLVATVVAGTPAEGLLVSRGFAAGQGYRRLRLDVAGCDQDELRAVVRAASEGYHLARWQGVVPADLSAAYARARNAMGDTADELDEVRAPWDEERVRRLAERHAARGDALLTVAALCEDEQGHEAVAGFSEIVLRDGAGPVARQSDTAVDRAHRGRGLGLWVKASMLQWLLGAHPEVAVVETLCAETNEHMIAINERLGFRTVGQERAFRLALD